MTVKERFEDFHRWLIDEKLEWAAVVPLCTAIKITETTPLADQYKYVKWITHSSTNINDIFRVTLMALHDGYADVLPQESISHLENLVNSILLRPKESYTWTTYLTRDDITYQLFKRFLKEYLAFCKDYQEENNTADEWEKMVSGYTESDIADSKDFLESLLAIYKN